VAFKKRTDHRAALVCAGGVLESGPELIHRDEASTERRFERKLDDFLLRNRTQIDERPSNRCEAKSVMHRNLFSREIGHAMDDQPRLIRSTSASRSEFKRGMTHPL
jgi:hypothetical protein